MTAQVEEVKKRDQLYQPPHQAEMNAMATPAATLQLPKLIPVKAVEVVPAIDHEEVRD